jgi:hypothetical protein
MSSGASHHQQLQPKILINNLAHHNKENVGILSNTQQPILNAQVQQF